jgi:hypothetical protein
MEGVLMRRFLLTVAMVAGCTVTAAAAEPQAIELRSGTVSPGVPLAEHSAPVFGFRLVAKVDKNGEGTGTLELDPNAPTFDEFGFMSVKDTLPPVKLDCSLKFVKRKKFEFTGPRAHEEDWMLFDVRGPKITTRMTLATLAERVNSNLYGRFVILGKDGKPEHVIGVSTPPPPEPCHPGCFPAGTLVATPKQTRPIETIRKGDEITTIGADGRSAAGQVASVFVTRNRLLEVQTDAGALLTTETQPLAMADGGLRAAGELKAGDKIWRWDGERRPVVVRSVERTGRETTVYNVILADSGLFVANGYLARSKPPAPAAGKVVP